MSTPAEKVAAQRWAFEARAGQPWERHLIGPVELSALMSELERQRRELDEANASLEAEFGTGEQ